MAGVVTKLSIRNVRVHRLAREARYRKITLWTHSIPTAARSIYQRAGFKLIVSKAPSEFRPRPAAEPWELEL
jgi:hypothetical protein